MHRRGWSHDHHSGPDRAPARTPRLVVAILVVLMIAIPVLAFPYVLLDRAASRIDVQTDLRLDRCS